MNKKNKYIRYFGKVFKAFCTSQMMVRASFNVSSSKHYSGDKAESLKKILLVNPPSGFLMDERVFLPLGIASIAAVAKQQGHYVDLIDLAGVSDYQGLIKERVDANNYDLVGITATSPQFYYAHRILKSIRTSKNSPKVVIGGSHASMFSALRKNLTYEFKKKGITNPEKLEEVLHEHDFNFSTLEEFDVIADGEESSLNAAMNANPSNTYEKWVDGGLTRNLDSLPFPDRSLFDMKSYLYDKNGSPKFKIDGKPTGSIISQRGCPYTCEFCCGRDSAMYHRVVLPGMEGESSVRRVHSPERILNELKHMNENFGLSSFMFYDDEFNLHPSNTKALCETLSNTGFKFRGFVKSDLLVRSPEIAISMKKAGFKEVLTGVESGSERILSRHLHKSTSPELNYRAAMLCLENDIGFKALTMLGHTSETEEDILKTRDWLLRTGKEFVNKLGPGSFNFDLTVFQPYAGCPIWDKAERNEGEFSDSFKWVYFSRDKQGNIVDKENGGMYFNKVDFSTEHGFYKGIPGEYKAFIRTKGVSSERYVSLRDEIEAEVRDKLKMDELRKSQTFGLEQVMGQTLNQKK